MNQDLQNSLYREDITLATIKKRSMAFFIDEMLLSLILILALGNSFFEAKSVGEMIDLTNKFILEYTAMKVIYQAFFTMQYGATIGKIVLKISLTRRRIFGPCEILVSRWIMESD